ncbi:MAG TPA: hypothetical protein VIN67_09325 [Desulfobaccales bacterium]
MAAQIKEWAAKMEVWKAKAAKASAEARIELNKQIEILRPKLAAAQQKLKEMQAASEPAWGKFKESSTKAMSDLKEAWEAAKSKFEQR